jgi:hypothetical protein
MTRRQEFNCRHAVTLKAYEGYLADKNGWNTPANRYRSVLKRFDGDTLATVAHYVRNVELSVGLKGLASRDQLEWSCEQLVLDFPDLFAGELVQNAALRLVKVRAWSARQTETQAA